LLATTIFVFAVHENHCMVNEWAPRITGDSTAPASRALECPRHSVRAPFPGPV
jgi:hypothetical protein